MRRDRVVCYAAFVVLSLAVCAGDPLFVWGRAWWNDRPSYETLPPGMVDDASRLNRTAAETWVVPDDAVAAESRLHDLLARARRDKLKVAIAGARHSMGGHTIYPDGIVLDMLPLDDMRLDEARGVLHVGAGARWSEVIPFLEARGRSVGVMQSNNDFTVGGSISVNCHGWQHARPPIASTVAAFRLMRADGSVVRCSRSENAELFSLALGGYGLFGIILDVELRTVPNERYRPEFDVVPIERFATRFIERSTDDDVGMAFGRLCVVPGAHCFLREGALVVFRRDPCERELMPRLEPLAWSTLRRQVYRAQIGSAEGKQIRWQTEKSFARQMSGRHFSRNQLLFESAEVLRERNDDRTDILHEYFVPPRQFEDFVAQMRTIVPSHEADLLNVTVRHVLQDDETVLRYADREMLALVLLFSQPRTPVGEESMTQMTRDLIEAALDCGGRYYLPYRLHATSEQFRRAYPQAAQFFERKRHYDPDELFQNAFYVKYGR